MTDACFLLWGDGWCEHPDSLMAMNLNELLKKIEEDARSAGVVERV